MDRVEAASEVAFRVGFTGHSGHLWVEPLDPLERNDPVKSLPDFILPPAFPRETPESVKKHIEEKYLTPSLDPDIFSAENAGRQWDFDWFEMAKVPLEPSLPRSVIVQKWELPFRRNKSGSMQGIWVPSSVQVDVSELVTGAQDNDPPLQLSGSRKDFARGSVSNRPFCPGGFESSRSSQKSIPDGATNGEWIRELREGGPAQKAPPGFKRGLEIGDLKQYPSSWHIYKDDNQLDSSSDVKLSELSAQFDDLFTKAWEREIAECKGDEEMPMKTDSDSCSVDLPVEVTEHELYAANEILLGESCVLPAISNENNDREGHQKEEAFALGRSSEVVAEHFHELVPDMALAFPFELDAFQKEAIYYLEKGESVFVAAHTSAGKTVIAEYAFALASRHCTRAIYTAPIKTISNQKYRDFCPKFDVGILTGDISLRPEASCLIMTTEILRSMLYRGADIIPDIEWVIFDEVHYVNDAERGVVWEEVIIMLPKQVNIVLLSATVPNTLEFADWISRTKQKKIHVIETTKRPVPLEHFLFYSGGLYKVCENETLVSHGLKAAKIAYKKKNENVVSHFGRSNTGPLKMYEGYQHHKIRSSKNTTLRNLSGISRVNQGNGSSQNNSSPWKPEASVLLQLIDKLSKNSLLPVVIFCFSKNRCDKSANHMCGIDLTSSSEKGQIHVFCEKAFSRLKGSDRNLPQIIRVQGLLHKGIGVHHAGLLPIVKEVVEMLFCRGVIKILFSTETFAMGVNAPARTVVFDALRKFDGKEFRDLLPGEYTQMAGRAGRRGLDNIGTVVILCREEIPEESDLKRAILGIATRLKSQFRLTYIMILHLLRVEELKVEDMLKRSFAEFHAQTKLPEKHELLKLKLAHPVKEVDCIKGEPAIEDYYDLYFEAEKYRNQILEAVMQSHSSQQFLTQGRVVVVKSESMQDPSLGVLVKSPSACSKQHIVLVLRSDLQLLSQAAISNWQDKSGDFLHGYVLLPKSKRRPEEYFSSVTSRRGSGVINIRLPYQSSAAGVSFEVRGIDNQDFLSICKCRIKIDQVGLLEDGSNDAFTKTVQQLSDLELKYGNKFPPALDPLKDLKLNDIDLVEGYHTWNGLLQKMAMNKCHGCIKFEEHFNLTKNLRSYQEEVNILQFQMSDEALQQMPDFQGRIDVLKEIGCIDDDLVVQIKGRVACEMNSGEELICTECLFENQLHDLDPEEAVAIMSAFVFQQNKSSEPSLTPKLLEAKNRLYATAIRLGELQARMKLQVDPEEYAIDNLKFGLVEVVHEWAKGTPFADICMLTDVPEGLIVRTIVRLGETCREFRSGAAIMGDSLLSKKMEVASNAIKRDIVFAASLYITGIE